MSDVTKQTTETRTVVVDTLCDLCGLSIKDKSRWPVTDESGPYDEDAVEIGHNTAIWAGREIFSSRRLEIDCCPACWNDKVLPFLRSIGLKREYKET